MELLTSDNISVLVNEILSCNEKKEDILICESCNDFLFIDIKRKMAFVYAQYGNSFANKKEKIYDKLEKFAYEGTGADTWSKGQNLFP